MFLFCAIRHILPATSLSRECTGAKWEARQLLLQGGTSCEASGLGPNGATSQLKPLVAWSLGGAEGTLALVEWWL